MSCILGLCPNLHQLSIGIQQSVETKPLGFRNGSQVLTWGSVMGLDFSLMLKIGEENSASGMLLCLMSETNSMSQTANNILCQGYFTLQGTFFFSLLKT